MTASFAIQALRSAARLAPLLGPSSAAHLYRAIAVSLAPVLPSRHVIRANRAFFGLPGAEGERDAEVLGHFGAYLGEFLGAAGDRARISEVVVRTDFSALDEATRSGRGVAVVTAHFGNWEMGALALGQHRPDAAMLIRTIGDPVLDRAVRRARGGSTLLDVADGVSPLRKVLQGGGVVAAALDEPRDRGLPVRFLGRMVSFPAAFFRVVAETRALVLPAYCGRREPGKVVVEVGEPVTDAGPVQTAQAVADTFSSWIRKDPDQWTMLRSFPG